MLERIEGVITDIIKHSDTHNVVTLYTRQRGRMAFLVPVGKSKSGKMRNASLQLMAVIAADVNIRANKEMHTLRGLTPLTLHHDIYFNPVKSSLLFFITEFCNRLLRQYPADEIMWKYLMHSLDWLDMAPAARIANFHLAFLIGMASVSGICPPADRWEENDRFDMLTGEMVADRHTEFIGRRILLSETESKAVPKILRMKYANMHLFRLSREERNRILERILEYYAVHLSLNKEFKSLDVLREMFSSL